MCNLKRSSLFFCFFLFLLSLGSPRVSADSEIVRFAGADRYETSVKVSQNNWDKSEYAVLVSGENFPDGISAAPLAKKYNAPILLTQSEELDSETIGELERLDVKNVFIIGGTGVISQNIENKLDSLNISHSRIGGQDRYETSLKVAEKIGTSNGVFISSGDNFPDALSASPIAAEKQMPILFSTSKTLPDSIDNYIHSNNISKSYIIGGNGVISDVVLNSIPNAKRLGGVDRYETNLKILDEFEDELNFNNVYVATGEDFPDALSASAAAAKNSNPLVLTNGSYSSCKSLIQSKKDTINLFKVLGGTSIVPDEAIENMLSPNKTVLGYTTYYSSGDKSSYNSMLNNSNLIDQIATDTYTVDKLGNINGLVPQDQINFANNNNIETSAMIANNFDSDIAKSLLESSANRQTLIKNILNELKTNNYKGVNIDLESIYSYDRQYLTYFMQELYNTLHPLGYDVTISVPAKTTDNVNDSWAGAYDYAQIAQNSDKIILMTYDEHWSGGTPGAIASLDWVKTVVSYATTVIPKEKIILGIADYAYDWPSNGTKASAYGEAQAYDKASKYGAEIKWDSTSESPYFNYTDSSGIYHTVWFENSTSLAYKLDLVNQENLPGIAIWRLGLESTDFWTTISTKLNR